MNSQNPTIIVLDEDTILVDDEKITKDDIITGIEALLFDDDYENTLSTREIEDYAEEIWIDLHDNGVQAYPCDLINATILPLIS